MEETSPESLLSLNIDYDAGNILKETVRWTKFIAVVGIIGVAIFALVLAFAGSSIVVLYGQMFPAIQGFASIIIFLAFIVVVVLGLMVFLLYRFSTLTKKGIEAQDQSIFNKGLNALKIYFILNGVFAILSLIGNFSKFF